MLLLACEQAHLYGVSSEYFGGEADRASYGAGKNFSRGLRRVALEALPPGYPPYTPNTR